MAAGAIRSAAAGIDPRGVAGGGTPPLLDEQRNPEDEWNWKNY
jgi:hypothetical protein